MVSPADRSKGVQGSENLVPNTKEQRLDEGTTGKTDVKSNEIFKDLGNQKPPNQQEASVKSLTDSQTNALFAELEAEVDAERKVKLEAELNAKSSGTVEEDGSMSDSQIEALGDVLTSSQTETVQQYLLEGKKAQEGINVLSEEAKALQEERNKISDSLSRPTDHPTKSQPTRGLWERLFGKK